MTNVVRCSNCSTLLEEDPNLERQPCPICGSTARTFEVTLRASVSLDASISGVTATAQAIAQPPQVDAKASILLEAGFRLEWRELTERGAWLVMVYRGGELIDIAAGVEPEDALLAIIETLLPETG